MLYTASENAPNVSQRHLWFGYRKYTDVTQYLLILMEVLGVFTQFEAQRSKFVFYVPSNSQGHIGTDPQHCHLWESNPHRGNSL